MKARESLMIRADADKDMGTGHLLRCLALGQTRRDAGGEILFLTRCAHENLLRRIRDEGFFVCLLTDPDSTCDNLQQEERFLHRHPRSWFVLDGYHFDSSYQRRLKTLAGRLQVINDMGHLPFCHADLVLNQNIHLNILRARTFFPTFAFNRFHFWKSSKPFHRILRVLKDD